MSERVRFGKVLGGSGTEGRGLGGAGRVKGREVLGRGRGRKSVRGMEDGWGREGNGGVIDGTVGGRQGK